MWTVMRKVDSEREIKKMERIKEDRVIKKGLVLDLRIF